MNASAAPVFGDPIGNRYRTLVAEALYDVEADRQQHGYILRREDQPLGAATVAAFRCSKAW